MWSAEYWVDFQLSWENTGQLEMRWLAWKGFRGWALGSFLTQPLLSLSIWTHWKMSITKGRAETHQPCLLSQHTRRKRRTSFGLILALSSPPLWGVLHVRRGGQGLLPRQPLWCPASVHFVLRFADMLLLCVFRPQSLSSEDFTALSFTRINVGRPHSGRPDFSIPRTKIKPQPSK